MNKIDKVYFGLWSLSMEFVWDTYFLTLPFSLHISWRSITRKKFPDQNNRYALMSIIYHDELETKACLTKRKKAKDHKNKFWLQRQTLRTGVKISISSSHKIFQHEQF